MRHCEFQQGANDEQLDRKFDDAAATLDQSKLIQISSDGSNGNLKISKIIADQREERNRLPYIDIGTLIVYCSEKLTKFFLSGKLNTY